MNRHSGTSRLGLALKSPLFRHSRNYLVAELFNSGLNFLTIPIFTRMLAPEEYGKLSIFASIATIFSILLGLNLHGSVSIKYYEDKEDFSRFIGTNLLFSLAFNAAMVAILYLAREPMARFFQVDSRLFFFAIILSSLSFFIQLELSYLQASQQSGKYAILSVTRNTLMTIAAVAWVSVLSVERYLGKVYSQLLVTALVCCFALSRLAKLSTFKPEARHVRFSVAFGVPLIPHALSGYILAQFDRVIINQVFGSYDTGIYSFAYNVGTLMNVVVMAANKAWVPFFFKELNAERRESIQEAAGKYAKAIFFIALGLILFSREIILVMADSTYFAAIRIVPQIVLGYVAVFMYTLYANYAFYAKKTFMVSLFTFIAGFVNVGLNYLLLPRLGYTAAAWTTLACYILLLALHYVNCKYILKLKPLKIMPLVRDFSAMLVAVAVFYSTEGLPAVIRVLGKVTLLGAVGVLYARGLGGSKVKA